jgi:hypothetical protein
MNKEFIPYEQALALKELGFHEPCFGWFDTGYLRVGCFESESVTGLGDLPAPLYQQAFRWFREKHGLRHFIEYDYGYYNAVIQPILVYSHCDTHEEAELACLKKLIELSTETNKP